MRRRASVPGSPTSPTPSSSRGARSLDDDGVFDAVVGRFVLMYQPDRLGEEARTSGLVLKMPDAVNAWARKP